MYAFQSEKMKVKAWWIMHLIIFCFDDSWLLGLFRASLSVPGRVLACPCPPSGQGIQRCAEDGSRFLACECGHLEPPISSLNEKQSHLNMGAEVQVDSPQKSTSPRYLIQARKAVQVNEDDTKGASVFSLVNQANSILRAKQRVHQDHQGNASIALNVHQ